MDTCSKCKWPISGEASYIDGQALCSACFRDSWNNPQGQRNDGVSLLASERLSRDCQQFIADAQQELPISTQVRYIAAIILILGVIVWWVTKDMFFGMAIGAILFGIILIMKLLNIVMSRLLRKSWNFCKESRAENMVKLITWQVVAVLVLLCAVFVYWREEIRPIGIVKECSDEAISEAMAMYKSTLQNKIDFGNYGKMYEEQWKQEIARGTYSVNTYQIGFNECLANRGVFNRKFYKSLTE